MPSKTIESLLKKLPQTPGVYKFKDSEGKVLYVGKAKNLKNRVKTYFVKQKNRAVRTEKLVSKVVDIEWIEVGSDWEAILLETNLIKELKPKYNVLMKDDKNFVYIKITKNEDYPRIKIVRKVIDDGSKYFGPKTSAHKVKKTLLLLQKLFKYRSCDLGIDWSDGKVKISNKSIAYPCLDFHIKRCEAPCIAKISPEEYRQSIEQIELFLEGNTSSIEESLKQQIQSCIDSKSFEKAVILRDKLLSIQDLMKDQRVTSPEQENMDVISFVLSENKAYFNLFMLRSGKLINQENFVLSAPGYIEGEESFASDVLESFLYQYYERAIDIPKTILTPLEILEEDFFNSWLKQKKGKSVYLKFPQRGKKNDLLNLAQANALSFKKQHVARWAGFSEDDGNAMEELKKILELPRLPKRIECYDISHLSGEDTVASMVVFENGHPKKSDYRKFKLKHLEEGKIDDFASMKEILDRRLRYLSKGVLDYKVKKASSKKHKEDILLLKNEWYDCKEVGEEYKEHFIVYDGTTPVAIVWMSPGKNQTFLLRSLFVTRSYRGQGIASALIRYAAKKLKAKRIYLSCFDDVLKFYENNGFEVVKSMPKEFRVRYLDQVEREHPDKTIYILAFDPLKNYDKSFNAKPDLIIIDGGKGQLSSAIKSRNAHNLKIPMIGLAKREEDVYLEGKSLPVLIPKENDSLKLLQKLRNEAHRFAITFQRKSRKKHLTSSALDGIDGLGKIKKMKLLSAFGSLDGVKAAKLEDISLVVGKTLAEKIQQELS